MLTAWALDRDLCSEHLDLWEGIKKYLINFGPRIMSLLLVSSWCRFFDLTAVDCRLSGRGIIWLDIWWEMFFAYAVKQSVAASTVYLYVSMNT